MFPEHTLLNVLLLVGLWLLLPLLSPDRMRWRAVVLLPLIPVQVFYVCWRYSATLHEFETSVAVLWQYLFFLTELLVVVYCAWQCLTLVVFTRRSEQCDVLLESVKGRQSHSIDLFIPTHSESREILSGTIKAAKNDDSKSLTVWICDDGNRSWLKDLCARERVHYLSRPDDAGPRTKAANLHWSIPHGQAEYVVCLDADFQLHPSLTTRLCAFLVDSEVGLVQAPQHFRNLDPVQRNLFGGAAWTEEQRFFFDVSLPSRDAWGNALCVGSCWATKRQVIEELGGFPTRSIVEDVYFGYQVKALGYRTVYLNESLATGLAAEDTRAYIVQRTRWCQGAMALLRDPKGPFRLKGLSWIDRVFYFEVPFYWMTHLHLLLLLLAPAVFGWFGINVFNCTTEELFGILLPKNILVCAVFYWISRGRCMPVVTPVQKTLAIFHVTPALFRGLLFPDKSEFHVTRKDIKHTGRTIHWRLAAPFVVVGVLTMSATLKTLSQNYSEFYWSDYSAYNLFLSAYSLVTVLFCCLVCVDKPVMEKHRQGSIPLQGSWLRTTIVLTKRVFV